ncbi:MAG TPA: hypothetical protein DCE33_06465, partial [Rhodospirillaceae bacterium]|nr:hypothetical protein [Rhodospirillaceae bacterium]
VFALAGDSTTTTSIESLRADAIWLGIGTSAAIRQPKAHHFLQKNQKDRYENIVPVFVTGLAISF